MRVIHNVHEVSLEQDSVQTIGAFDGLHVGHQELLRGLIRRASEAGRLSGMVTFDPLPRSLFQQDRNFRCLTTMDEKISLLDSWGLDVLTVFSFTQELQRQSARQFVQPLVEHLRMVELWIGWNFALGHNREGDAPTLKALGRELGFEVHVLSPVREGDTIVSSTHIRSLLAMGRVAEAAEMLGRYHELRGFVAPSPAAPAHAKVLVDQTCTLPGSGVYAVYVLAQGQTHPALVDIPGPLTGSASESAIDLHLLDPDRDPRNQSVRLQLVERLHDQWPSQHTRQRRLRIRKDIETARELLG